MSPEAGLKKENPEQEVASFIDGMVRRRIDGPKRGKLDLDTFVLLTYDQRTRRDEIEFASWSSDRSISNLTYLKILMNFLKLPKEYNHPPFPIKQTDMEFYEDRISHEKGKVPAIALGIGPSGRVMLYRHKWVSTKNSFERLQKAISSTVA